MTSTRIRRLAMLAGAALLTFPALAACGGAAENVAQNVAEQAAENAMGGGDVDISDDSMTMTDAEGNQLAIGADVSLPDSWPAEIPLLDGGTLSVASVQADGTAYAMWSTEDTPVEAADAYGAQLEAAGFAMDQDADLAGTIMREYRSVTQTVSVVSADVDGTTNLTVTVLAN